MGSLCRRKGIEIIEAECCPDHIHMLVRIPPKYSVSEIVGYLKGKSSLMIFERHANLKYKYGNRHFWCRGYCVDTVGKNTAKIKEYIQNQLKEDLQYDQMSLVEYIDPFTGRTVPRQRRCKHPPMPDPPEAGAVPSATWQHSDIRIPKQPMVR